MKHKNFSDRVSQSDTALDGLYEKDDERLKFFPMIYIFIFGVERADLHRIKADARSCNSIHIHIHIAMMDAFLIARVRRSS